MLSQKETKTVIYNVGDLDNLKVLINSAKDGDKKAFDLLYKELFTPLYRYTFSKCKDKNLTEDICQQTFLNFYKALPFYELNKSPLAYLFTISKRLLINCSEKKSSIPLDESLLETITDENIDILDEVNTKTLSRSINEYIPLLTSDEQEVIRLYFYSELEYKEISDILEKKVVYVRKIKERALKRLKSLTQHLK